MPPLALLSLNPMTEFELLANASNLHAKSLVGAHDKHRVKGLKCPWYVQKLFSPECNILILCLLHKTLEYSAHVLLLHLIIHGKAQEKFYLLFEQNSEFRPKFRNSGSTFLCQHETSHTACYTCKLPKTH